MSAYSLIWLLANAPVPVKLTVKEGLTAFVMPSLEAKPESDAMAKLGCAGAAGSTVIFRPSVILLAVQLKLAEEAGNKIRWYPSLALKLRLCVAASNQALPKAALAPALALNTPSHVRPDGNTMRSPTVKSVMASNAPDAWLLSAAKLLATAPVEFKLKNWNVLVPPPPDITVTLLPLIRTSLPVPPISTLSELGLPFSVKSPEPITLTTSMPFNFDQSAADKVPASPCNCKVSTAVSALALQEVEEAV